MGNLRSKTIRDIGKARTDIPPSHPGPQRKTPFGAQSFELTVMQKKLPSSIFNHLKEVMQGRAKLKLEHADAIAEAMSQWAIEQGATHFCHWFQPMTGLTAEKQEAFADWNKEGKLIEKFKGKHLLRGEPDASSLPAGGLRSTDAARGYTAWDATSLPFLWEMGGMRVLCIPSIFYSWTGKALDMKIPLLRSEAKLGQAALRLLNLFEFDAKAVYTTLGCEQEYFLIDRAFYHQRPDLVLTGRTLFGAAAAKGQDLQDHYFGAIQERVAAFIAEFEDRAWTLGIPLKARHKEVAPGQYEVAPLFERSSAAIDHNILLMELMCQVATRHRLACLLHEKPFARLNGSGKHCNWSLSTDRGHNLLDPATYTEKNHHVFYLLLAAIIDAVYRHAPLLRAAIATAGNDHRLGGHEAPPAIISVYLGQVLEKVLTGIEQDRAHASRAGKDLDLGVPAIPELTLDDSDRNRTSPFAFTGSKFEFRAVGSSQNCAQPVTVLNAIVADSLNRMIDAIERGVGRKKTLKNAAEEVLRKILKESRAVRFTGDGYSSAWQKEAKKRKLPNITKAVYAMDVYAHNAAVQVFEGVLSKEELLSRVEIMKERYCSLMRVEANLFEELFYSQVLPAAFEYQNDIARSLKNLSELKIAPPKQQMALLHKLSAQIERALERVELLKKQRGRALSYALSAQAEHFCDEVGPAQQSARKEVDELEKLMDDRLWPLPKYREMLAIL